MATTPPAPPPGRKTGSQGPPLSEDYGDYNDFESDATNVNQIPQAGMLPAGARRSRRRCSRRRRPRSRTWVAPQQPVPPPLMMQMPTNVGMRSARARRWRRSRA